MAPKPRARFEIFTGRDDRCYWRFRDPEGSIVATGGQGFASEIAARADIRRAIEAARGNPRIDVIDS